MGIQTGCDRRVTETKTRHTGLDYIRLDRVKLTKQLKKELIESKHLFATQTYEDCLELFHDHEYLPQLMRIAVMLDEGVISD